VVCAQSGLDVKHAASNLFHDEFQSPSWVRVDSSRERAHGEFPHKHGRDRFEGRRKLEAALMIEPQFVALPLHQSACSFSAAA